MQLLIGVILPYFFLFFVKKFTATAWYKNDSWKIYKKIAIKGKYWRHRCLEIKQNSIETFSIFECPLFSLSDQSEMYDVIIRIFQVCLYNLTYI